MLSVKLKGLIFSRFYFKLKFFHKNTPTDRATKENNQNGMIRSHPTRSAGNTVKIL